MYHLLKVLISKYLIDSNSGFHLNIFFFKLAILDQGISLDTEGWEAPSRRLVCVFTISYNHDTSSVLSKHYVKACFVFIVILSGIKRTGL